MSYTKDDEDIERSDDIPGDAADAVGRYLPFLDRIAGGSYPVSDRVAAAAAIVALYAALRPLSADEHSPHH